MAQDEYASPSEKLANLLHESPDPSRQLIGSFVFFGGEAVRRQEEDPDFENVTRGRFLTLAHQQGISIDQEVGAQTVGKLLEWGTIVFASDLSKIK